MASVTFTIADTDSPDLLAALSQRYFVPQTLPAVRAAVIADWIQIVANYRLAEANAAALAAVQSPALPAIT